MTEPHRTDVEGVPVTSSQVSREHVRRLADEADRVAEQVRDADRPRTGEPLPPGWLFSAALPEVEAGWHLATERCAETWNEFAGLLDTAADEPATVDAETAAVIDSLLRGRP
ncbi:hypothetical protein LX16_2984 [Stackebrandtia albiflava]|uniref:Excreted virulence factor EspC (Type VII ESX diderm) n=1 Tax=Stackebrandtia albiflava TaxID=406432 RepID=A0A562V2V9_9ACTN|nr:hypothetical protein [Stackebrandtia albiflava]TWJ12229.1 hypothetical protein LX16_2984 [Stackebrandtia albiflava]